jgi:hypothetical protein
MTPVKSVVTVSTFVKKKILMYHTRSASILIQPTSVFYYVHSLNIFVFQESPSFRIHLLFEDVSFTNFFRNFKDDIGMFLLLNYLAKE